MSMYEIESLMENTVRLIDKSSHSAATKRNLIWNVYNLQNKFDCSFTHFRLMDILIKYDFVQQYKIKDFPMYSDFPDFHNKLLTKDFEWIRQNPNEKWSDSNPEIAYWDHKSKRIYVDFGSEYYTLQPEETTNEIEPFDFGIKTILEGHKQKNKSIIYDWTAFMIVYLLGWFPTKKSLHELKANYFSTIKPIFQTYDYSNYEPLHQGLDLLNDDNSEWLGENQKELIQFILKK